MEKPLKVRLHILSPVHIGCDDVYEPTSFVIDERKGMLIEFDPMDFIKALSKQEKDEFSNACSNDNLLVILKTIRRLYKPSIKGFEVDIATGLLAHYKKVLAMSTFDKKAVINQFTMNRTAYNPNNNLPYIPGSSLKGSLRTAYLSFLSEKENKKNYWNNFFKEHELQKPDNIYYQIGKRQVAKKLEKDLLNGDFETDPFRLIKVSDFLPIEKIKTKVVYAVNRKKKESDKASLADSGNVYQIFETIQSGTVFEGVINMDRPGKNANINMPITKDQLLLAAHKFYARVLNEEIAPIKVLGLKHSAGMMANNKFKDKFNKTAFLMRLGRHSGAEAVTIKENRFIKIMQGKDKRPIYSDHATTFWLASEEAKPKDNHGLQPFGWAVLEVL